MDFLTALLKVASATFNHICRKEQRGKQPLPSCCSQTGWKIAPALFTKPALTVRTYNPLGKYPQQKKHDMPFVYQQTKTPPLPEANAIYI
jgi:hypothetical protein